MISWILKTDPNNSRLVVVSFPGLGALRKFHAGQMTIPSNNISNSDNLPIIELNNEPNYNSNNYNNVNNSFKTISYERDSFFNKQMTQRSQSFTSLMTDLHQDIEFLHLEEALMEHLLEGIAPLR